MKKILAFLTGTMLLFAGCGGGQKTLSEQGTVTEGKLVVGMECNYSPFNWTQIEENETSVSLGNVGYADGYDVVIAKRMADALGLELEIKKIAWDGLEPALSAGEIDVIIAGMTATPERKENADFTDPYYASDMVVIVKNDGGLTDIKSISDLSGKKVLGQKNTVYDAVIDQIEAVDHQVPLDDYPKMVMALQSGAADALVAEMPVALGVVYTNPNLAVVRFDEGQGFDADTSVSIGIKKGNDVLYNKLQDALKEIPEEERDRIMEDAVKRQPSAES